ncbi:hypothetical protein [Ruminococcus sp.]|uniref:hypothetical protein n=1 Tax=Ruminococcus sp. TaxID=41978 RepID=UPI0025DECDBA|nr:hypothetical protein [Ruminococcus sp.]
MPSLLQNVDSLYTIINNIYTALGMKPCSPSLETKSTKEQLNIIESIVVDMSKLCFEHFEKQAIQSTVKRTIIHEEITENEESESTASVETETASYKSQFVKSFGNRIF